MYYDREGSVETTTILIHWTGRREKEAPKAEVHQAMGVKSFQRLKSRRDALSASRLHLLTSREVASSVLNLHSTSPLQI